MNKYNYQTYDYVLTNKVMKIIEYLIKFGNDKAITMIINHTIKTQSYEYITGYLSGLVEYKIIEDKLYYKLQVKTDKAFKKEPYNK